MSKRHLFLALLLTATAHTAMAGTVTQTNLTSDGAVPAAVTDPNLKNPWGISFAPGGAFWVSDNANGLTTLYGGDGSIVPLVVSIPASAGTTGPGSPTGQVFNATKDFNVSAGGTAAPAVFLFVTEDGTISGWNPSVNQAAAVVAVDRGAYGDVYKGIAAYTDPTSGKNYLLVTDFRGGVVDVFDASFHRLRAFRDTTLPANYSPYNIAVLNGSIYVTYAQVNAARHDSVNAAGAGAVEMISLSSDAGSPTLHEVVHARALHGALNGPWGLAIAPSSYGALAGDLLVGNFGSGHVAVFTPGLAPQGVLRTTGNAVLTINGLWALTQGNGGDAGSTGTIYFSAGPNKETDGLLGALNYVP
jgi:uncharacterized protein (TIGR03118 family)